MCALVLRYRGGYEGDDMMRGIMGCRGNVSWSGRCAELSGRVRVDRWV